MEEEFLKKSSFSKSDIMNHIIKPNNYDYLKSEQAMLSVMREENLRKTARQYTPVYLGITFVSLYNLFRIRQLSPSGKIMASTGFVFFSLLSSASVKKGFFH